ncbi:MAG TPA: PQQ-binding-like beta-propeller repeat protein, partial [Usitatibacter sp.]|nr:PQQ-binding-like beta-propeller repeat protein [Usitatibacter sp.]
MTLPRALAALAVAASLAGCSTYNPLVALGIQSEPAHKPTPLAPLKPSVTARAVWTAQVGKSEGFHFRPAVSGGRVFTAAADGNISVLDEDNGRVAAKIDTKKKLSGGVEVGDGKIFVGTMKGEVVALDLTGKTLWTILVAGEVIAPP